MLFNLLRVALIVVFFIQGPKETRIDSRLDTVVTVVLTRAQREACQAAIGDDFDCSKCDGPAAVEVGYCKFISSAAARCNPADCRVTYRSRERRIEFGNVKVIS